MSHPAQPLDKAHFGALENAVALSENFHLRKEYQAFYDANAAHAGGFAQLYGYVVQAAHALTQAEHPDCWEKQDWMETVDEFTTYLYADLRQKTVPELQAWAHTRLQGKEA